RTLSFYCGSVRGSFGNAPDATRTRRKGTRHVRPNRRNSDSERRDPARSVLTSFWSVSAPGGLVGAASFSRTHCGPTGDDDGGESPQTWRVYSARGGRASLPDVCNVSPGNRGCHRPLAPDS